MDMNAITIAVFEHLKRQDPTHFASFDTTRDDAVLLTTDIIQKAIESLPRKAHEDINEAELFRQLHLQLAISAEWIGNTTAQLRAHEPPGEGATELARDIVYFVYNQVKVLGAPQSPDQLRVAVCVLELLPKIMERETAKSANDPDNTSDMGRAMLATLAGTGSLLRHASAAMWTAAGSPDINAGGDDSGRRCQVPATCGMPPTRSAFRSIMFWAWQSLTTTLAWKRLR